MSEPNDKPMVQTRTRFPFIRRRRLVLASMIIVVVAVGGRAWYLAHRAELAIQEIERLGGVVKPHGRSWFVLYWIRRLGVLGEAPRTVDFSFSGREIVDSDLENLKHLPTLRHIELVHCGFTDAGFKHLIGLKHLNVLLLEGNSITDKTLKQLPRLAKLSQLTLINNDITDKGLKHLTRLTQLHFLSLENNDITDDGLTHLTGLTNLDFLILNDTKVTKKGVDALQKALPSCTIIHSDFGRGSFATKPEDAKHKSP